MNEQGTICIDCDRHPQILLNFRLNLHLLPSSIEDRYIFDFGYVADGIDEDGDSVYKSLIHCHDTRFKSIRHTIKTSAEFGTKFRVPHAPVSLTRSYRFVEYYKPTHDRIYEEKLKFRKQHFVIKKFASYKVSTLPDISNFKQASIWKMPNNRLFVGVAMHGKHEAEVSIWSSDQLECLYPPQKLPLCKENQVFLIFPKVDDKNENLLWIGCTSGHTRRAIPAIYQWSTASETPYLILIEPNRSAALQEMVNHIELNIYKHNCTCSASWKGPMFHYLICNTRWREQTELLLFVYNYLINQWTSINVKFSQLHMNFSLVVDQEANGKTPLMLVSQEREDIFDRNKKSVPYNITRLYRLPISCPDLLANLSHYKILELGFYDAREVAHNIKLDLRSRKQQIDEMNKKLEGMQLEYTQRVDEFKYQEEMDKQLTENLPPTSVPKILNPKFKM